MREGERQSDRGRETHSEREGDRKKDREKDRVREKEKERDTNRERTCCIKLEINKSLPFQFASLCMIFPSTKVRITVIFSLSGKAKRFYS